MARTESKDPMRWCSPGKLQHLQHQHNMDIFSDSDSNEGNPVSRTRRAAAETGSFGKSTRRSRSRTGTPAAKREDPTLAAADAIFAGFMASRAATPSESPQRKSSLSASASQPNLSTSGPLATIDGNSQTPSRYVQKEPTEVILRGFKETHQYAAIREYERIGGRICEDYPRDPPLEQRRYKSDLRDQATLRTQPMTAEEKAKALRFAGGDHWIKITFESADGAEAAIDASPQVVLGHSVYAELYRGIPPTADEEIPYTAGTPRAARPASGLSQESVFGHRGANTLPRSFTTPSMTQLSRTNPSISPPGSNTSSNTLDTTTLSASNTAASSITLIGQPNPNPQAPSDNIFCSRIPTARRARLLPAEQALLPQKSWFQQCLAAMPILNLLVKDQIGSQVPRDDLGKFDWDHASMYWKFMYWLDCWTGLLDLGDLPKEE